MIQKIKKPVSILLVFMMIVSLFAVVPFTASAATTGSFGSLTWNIDDDGTLTFSGSGSIPMDGFQQNGDVKKVIINDSVTALGAYAFSRCSNLTEVDIQNPSVSLIGGNQFSYTGATTVTLPEGMTTISQAMFRGCGALTTVDLPSTITSIADFAFLDSGLQSISVPEGATYDSSSFRTNSLQSLTLEGSSPMTFTGGEFTFLSDAATVYIPEGSTYVYSTTTATLYVKDPSNEEAQSMLGYAQDYFNDYMNYGCSPEEALEYINHDYHDLYGMNVTTEGPFTVPLNEGDKCEAVFGGATIGKYVPASTTYTVTWANWDNSVIKTDTVDKDAIPAYSGTVPEKAEDANYTYTFSGWKNGTNTYGKDETLPAVTADVTYTAQFDAYPKSGSFDGLNWSIDDEGTLTLSGSGAIPEDAFKSNPVIKKVIINSSVTGVGANAFADCANLAELTFDSKSPINFAGGEYTYLTDKTTVNVPADSTYQYTVKVSTLATEEPAYKDVLPTLQAEFKNLVAMGYSYEEALDVVLEDYAEWVEDQTGEYPIAHEFEVVLEDENRTGNLTDGQKCETVFGNANIHVFVPTYTVTWKNGDTVLTTDTVDKDAIPAYSGTVPEKAEDAENTYTFSGWTDGTNTYGATDTLPAVTGDVTYTATYTATAKPVELPEVIKDCTNQYLNQLVYANVPFITENQFSALKDGALYGYHSAGGSNILLYDAKGYSYKFYDKTGTQLELTTVNSTTAPGSAVGQSDITTVYAYEYKLPSGGIAYDSPLYIVVTAPKKLFVGHSVTLGGDIGVNFFINSAAADFANAETAVVKFTCDGKAAGEVDLKELAPDAYGYYKASVDVVAAQMAHKIHAEVYLDGTKLEQTDDYSVQDYAETVFANPEKYDSEKPEQLKALAKALLNYGAQAQIVFDAALTEKPALANTTVGENGFKDVTEDDMQNAINAANPNQTATDLSTVGADIGAKFYTHSLIYLSKNTLRLYFTPAQGMTMSHPEAFDGCHKNQYHYYVDKADIAAAELDNLQAFTVGDTTCYFSALDYAKAVAFHSGMPEAQKDLAKSLYLYNQAANAYFDAAPAQNIVDLSTLTGDYEAQNYDLLTGTLGENYKITIADGATVTLKDADIAPNYSAAGAGITLSGDATILLEGANIVKTESMNYPGIYVPANTTLTIDGDGSLTASGYYNASGIGGGYQMDAGNIVIKGGTITANGNFNGAGIGSGYKGSCGNITIDGGNVTATGGNGGTGIGSGISSSCGKIIINGGNVTAIGGQNGAGIGSGNSSSARCESITINGGTVTATGGDYGAGIGSSMGGSCGTITINGGTVAATGGDYGAGIGSSMGGSCGTITINGGTVTATGGSDAAGIGSGAYGASCGNITIADTVTQVTATKGGYAKSIGAGDSASCGDVTIAPGANVIQN